MRPWVVETLAKRAGIVFWFFGTETRGRSIEEIDAEMTAGAARKRVPAHAVAD